MPRSPLALLALAGCELLLLQAVDLLEELDTDSHGRVNMGNWVTFMMELKAEGVPLPSFLTALQPSAPSPEAPSAVPAPPSPRDGKGTFSHMPMKGLTAWVADNSSSVRAQLARQSTEATASLTLA